MHIDESAAYLSTVRPSVSETDTTSDNHFETSKSSQSCHDSSRHQVLSNVEHLSTWLETTKSPVTDSKSRCVEFNGNSLATNNVVPVTQSACSVRESHYEDGSTLSVCILCDEPVTVRLLPCRHEIMCLMCSKRAKKCLECKVRIVYLITICIVMYIFTALLCRVLLRQESIYQHYNNYVLSTFVSTYE